MRVLHVQKATGIGGSERHLLLLLPALAARGVEVEMCVLAAKDAHLFIDAMKAEGVDVSVLPAGPRVNPALSLRLGSVIRRFRPDVVHTHLVHADLYGQPPASVMGVPGVSSVHGAFDFYRRQPYRTATRLAGRLARRTIAISNFVAGFVVDCGLSAPGDVRVIHYGMDVSGWALAPPEQEEARQSFGVEPGEVTVGIASRLIPGKGHDVLLRAMALASEEAGDLRLLVAGTGPLRHELEALAEATCPPGRVRFLGFVSDVRGFMNACDFLAMPTQPELNEGFGLAALEAMAAGRPVVASAVGSLPEVVLDAETGFLVPPRSEQRLAQALVSLARDGGLRRRLGTQAAARAREVFGLEPMVERTAAVYEEVVGHPGRRLIIRPLYRGVEREQEDQTG